MTKQLHTNLIRGTRTARLAAGAHGGAAIAEAGGRAATQAMRINARHLRSNIGADAHQPTGLLVGKLEGFTLEIAASPVEQRVQKFN